MKCSTRRAKPWTAASGHAALLLLSDSRQSGLYDATTSPQGLAHREEANAQIGEGGEEGAQQLQSAQMQ